MRLRWLNTGALRRPAKRIPLSENSHFMSIKSFQILLIVCIFSLAGCAPSGNQPSSAGKTGLSTSTPVVVRILNLDGSITVSPVATRPPVLSTSTPVILPLPILQATIPTGESTPAPLAKQACTNRAEFVSSLSISDNTALKAGQVFTKVWRIRNIGTCSWTNAYTLRFYSGDAMGGPASVSLPNQIPPGATVDLHVKMVAPMTAASFTGNWILSDAQGKLFGIGTTGDQALSVVIRIKPTSYPTPG